MNDEPVEDIEENIYHLRILFYLILKYPKEIKTIYEISKYFKKGNDYNYTLAKADLIRYEYIIDSESGISLNPEKPQFKLLIQKIKENPIILDNVKKNREKYYNLLTNNESKKTLEQIWNIFQSSFDI